MSLKFGWFDVPIGGDPDKYNYSADEMRDLWKSILTDGIIPEIRRTDENSSLPVASLGNSMSVQAGSGLSVIINKGIGWIDGAYAIITAPEKIPIQAGWNNDIVLRLDLTGTDVVFGVFSKHRSAGTIEAGLIREGGIYELGLASVNVPADATAVELGMITDYRLNMKNGKDGKPCCGIVGSLLMPDVDKWYENATAEQREWAASSRAEFIDWMNKQEADFGVWESKSKADFDKWFASIVATLDGDIVTNLLNKINQNAAAIATLSASFPTTSTRTTHHTLTASRWQASGEAFVQVITLAASVAEDVTVEIGEVSEGMTLDKLEAIGAAMLTPTASTANTITVTAFGEKPEIDIPVFVTVFGLFND